MLAFEHVLIVGGTSKTIGERSRQESVNEARARPLTNSFHSVTHLLRDFAPAATHESLLAGQTNASRPKWLNHVEKIKTRRGKW